MKYIEETGRETKLLLRSPANSEKCLKSQKKATDRKKDCLLRSPQTKLSKCCPSSQDYSERH